MYTHLTPPPSTPAPCAPQYCTRFFPGRDDQVRLARALTERFHDGHPAADDAVLLISELAANAIAHSASGQPGGTFTLRVQVRDGCVRGEVEDQGSHWDGNISAASHRTGSTCSASAGGARRADHGWAPVSPPRPRLTP